MTTNIVGRCKALFTNLCCVMTQWWHWPYLYHYCVIIIFMRCQVRILHIRRHDYRSNNEVLRHTGLLAASSIVCKRHLGLFGHVARLADDVPANRILRTCCEAQDGVRPCSDWRRARGRPPTTWTQQICRDTGVTVTDVLWLAEDRSFWR